MPPVTAPIPGPRLVGAGELCQGDGETTNIQAQELGGDGQLCHLNAKRLVLYVPSTSVLQPCYVPRTILGAGDKTWIWAPAPVPVYVLLKDVTVWESLKYIYLFGCTGLSCITWDLYCGIQDLVP